MANPPKLPPSAIWSRRIVLTLTVLLLLWVIRARLQQADQANSAALEVSLLELSQVLRTTPASELTQASLARAQTGFSRAVSLSDVYARFCVSVVDELVGTFERAPGASPRWPAAVESLRNNELREAREAFHAIAMAEGTLGPRAALYVRLIDDLIRLQPSVASQP